MGVGYNHYQQEYYDGLTRGFFETFTLNETALLGVCKTKGKLPKTNLPYVVSKDNKSNTHGKTIVLVDSSGLRDTEADLRYVNMIMTAVWEDPTIAERFINTRKFATKAYMNWIGRALKARYNFSFEDQAEINTLTAVYYYCTTGEPKDILAERNYKAYADLGEITGLGVVRVKATIDRFKISDYDGSISFESIVNLMSQVSDDTKNKVSIQAVMSSMSTSWYGEGGVFYCNLALEYPPMFLSLLYFSLVDKTYTQTRFGKTISEFAVGRNVRIGEMFAKQINSQIKAYKVSAT